MKLNTLRVDCCADGSSAISVWCDCHTTEDVEDIIAWLHAAKKLHMSWRGIRAPHVRKSTVKAVS